MPGTHQEVGKPLPTPTEQPRGALGWLGLLRKIINAWPMKKKRPTCAWFGEVWEIDADHTEHIITCGECRGKGKV